MPYFQVFSLATKVLRKERGTLGVFCSCMDGPTFLVTSKNTPVTPTLTAFNFLLIRHALGYAMCRVVQESLDDLMSWRLSRFPCLLVFSPSPPSAFSLIFECDDQFVDNLPSLRESNYFAHPKHKADNVAQGCSHTKSHLSPSSPSPRHTGAPQTERRRAVEATTEATTHTHTHSDAHHFDRTQPIAPQAAHLSFFLARPRHH